MFRAILAGYVFPYSLGGMRSDTLQYLIGLIELNNDVFLGCKVGCDKSCFDSQLKTLSKDWSYGIGDGATLLSRFNWNIK